MSAERVAFYKKLESIGRPSFVAEISSCGVNTEQEFTAFARTNQIWRLRAQGKRTIRKAYDLFGIPWPLKPIPNRAENISKKAEASKIAPRMLKRFKPLELSLSVRAGVYLLKREGKIMYVGQTTNILQRIGFHAFDKPKFDAVDFIEVKRIIRGRLVYYEKNLIRFLRPPWNGPRAARV